MRIFRTVHAAALLLSAGLVGCSAPEAVSCTAAPEDVTSTAAPEDVTSRTSARDDVSGICEDHFTDVRHAEASTVGRVRQVGPVVIDPPAGPLDAYPDDEPVALCLVPTGPAFDVVAIVLADGATFVRWTQNLGDAVYWPI